MFYIDGNEINVTKGDTAIFQLKLDNYTFVNGDVVHFNVKRSPKDEEYSISKEVREFKENIFKGLSYFSEYKYIIEDKKSKNITGFLTIKTSDNENYILDVVQTSWVELDINSILSYATYQIRKRKKRFAFFVRTKRYTALGEKYESQFIKNGFECVQNQIVLTNSSARVLKEPTKNAKYTVLSDFLPTKPVPTQCKEL